MTGSLQIKNGYYYAVLNLYDTNGKRRQKWLPSGLPAKGNKKKAESFLNEQIYLYENNKAITTEASVRVSFSSYISHWLEVSKKRLDEVTYQGYEVTAKAHIIPYFESNSVLLSDLNYVILQDYFDYKSEFGRKDGKGGLSAKTLRHHKNVISQTIKEAIKENLLAFNPCDKVVLPKLQRNEYSFFNAEQITSMFEALKDEPLLPLIKTTVYYGLRRSEVLGLKWDSVDFDRGLVTIKHTVSFGTKAVEKDKTKTTSSYRSFPLINEVREIFIEEKKKADYYQKLFGNEYEQNDYIFKQESGSIYAPEFITHKFNKLLKKYNLPHIRFHELRHSCASFLIANGFSLKDIQEWLGHSDIKLTANIYSHLDISRKLSMAESFSKRFG